MSQALTWNRKIGMGVAKSTALEQGTKALAIVLTRVVLSEAEVAKNEREVLTALGADFALIKQACADFGGRIIRQSNEGHTLLFNSAQDALECSLIIQSEFLASRKVSQNSAQHQIGVNLNENSASSQASLESLRITSILTNAAPPGGICISEAIYDLIKAGRNVPILGPIGLATANSHSGSHGQTSSAGSFSAYYIHPEHLAVQIEPSQKRISRFGTAIATTLAACLCVGGIAWLGSRLQADRTEKVASLDVRKSVARSTAASSADPNRLRVDEAEPESQSSVPQLNSSHNEPPSEPSVSSGILATPGSDPYVPVNRRPAVQNAQPSLVAPHDDPEFSSQTQSLARKPNSLSEARQQALSGYEFAKLISYLEEHRGPDRAHTESQIRRYQNLLALIGWLDGALRSTSPKNPLAFTVYSRGQVREGRAWMEGDKLVIENESHTRISTLRQLPPSIISDLADALNTVNHVPIREIPIHRSWIKMFRDEFGLTSQKS